MLSRREFLHAQMAGIAIIVVGKSSRVFSGPTDRSQVPSWTHYVRISGNGLSLDRVDQIVREATETHVFGIETDNDIEGRYESFLDPTEKLRAIKAVAGKAHAAGNYAFVYVAGLECITANAAQAAHSLYKDHPDWVQRKISGEPALFGGGTAFWIRQGDEDVWVSPYVPEWRKVYMQHIRQIAATGIDGVYVDIPYWMTHFRSWEKSWASFDRYTVAAFKAATGLDAMTGLKLGDFSDANFRRWVDFRIATITDFMKEIDHNFKSVNPRGVTIAEIYPGIEFEAVRVGSDVYQLYDVVDVIAHEYDWEGGASRAASKTPLDWLHYMIGMYTFRAFAGEKPTWMLSYSWDGEKDVKPADAMQNLFAAQLMAGTNCWDVHGHVMSGSNDLAMRKEIFGWIAEHEKVFYNPRVPVHPIGVYFSPRTRDYFADEYLNSYLGMMALLMHSHHEFRIVTPRTLESFSGPILALPEARCLADQEIAALQSYRTRDGNLIVTGQTSHYDDTGRARPSDLLHQLLGAENSKSAGGAKPQYAYFRDCPGRAYWRAVSAEFSDAAARGDATGQDFERLRGAFDRGALRDLKYSAPVKIEALPFVTSQTARVDGRIRVFLANFKGLRARENANQIPERNVAVSFPASAGTKVFVLPFLGKAQELPAERTGERLRAVIPQIDKGAVVWVE